jgi:hypothetical protein
MTSLAFAVAAVQESLQGRIDFPDRVQRLVVKPSQEARGLFLLGMLFQLDLAHFGDRLEPLLVPAEFVEKMVSLLAQQLC